MGVELASITGDESSFIVEARAVTYSAGVLKAFSLKGATVLCLLYFS